MNTQDEAAWNREFDHVEEKQKQREGWELKEGWDGKRVTFAGGHSYEVPEAIYSNKIYQVKDNDNEK